MTRYTEQQEPTVELDLTPYLEEDEPTLDVCLSKSDAIWASQEQERAGNVEAAGVWLAVAGGIDGR